MSELVEYQDARREGREVRVPHGSHDPLGELKDLYRRQAALRRAVELREKIGISPVTVGYTGDPDSRQDFNSDTEYLKRVEAQLEALKLQLGRFDPPDEPPR